MGCIESKKNLKLSKIEDVEFPPEATQFRDTKDPFQFKRIDGQIYLQLWNGKKPFYLNLKEHNEALQNLAKDMPPKHKKV